MGANCPVLVVNRRVQEEKLEFGKVMVCVDFSRSCECAVALCRAFGRPLRQPPDLLPHEGTRGQMVPGQCGGTGRLPVTVPGHGDHRPRCPAAVGERCRRSRRCSPRPPHPSVYAALRPGNLKAVVWLAQYGGWRSTERDRYCRGCPSAGKEVSDAAGVSERYWQPRAPCRRGRRRGPVRPERTCSPRERRRF